MKIPTNMNLMIALKVIIVTLFIIMRHGFKLSGVKLLFYSSVALFYRDNHEIYYFPSEAKNNNNFVSLSSRFLFIFVHKNRYLSKILINKHCSCKFHAFCLNKKKAFKDELKRCTFFTSNSGEESEKIITAD